MVNVRANGDNVKEQTSIETPTSKSLIRKILKRFKLEILVDFWEYSKGKGLQLLALLIAIAALYVSIVSNYDLSLIHI